jgi:hypothetical protein
MRRGYDRRLYGEDFSAAKVRQLANNARATFEKGIICVCLPVGIVTLADIAQAEERHELTQRRVDTRAMQTLAEVLPEHLPVAFDGLGVGMGDHQILEGPALEPARLEVERLFQRGRLPP